MHSLFIRVNFYNQLKNSYCSEKTIQVDAKILECLLKNPTFKSLKEHNRLSLKMSILSSFPQTLFFESPVSCRLVKWKGIQEYPD